MGGKLMTTGEAARLCSVTPDTILKWIRSGKLPASRTAGGHHRVKQNDLMKLTQADAESPKSSWPGKETPLRYCWEYNGKGKLLDGCRDCIVYEMRARRCYEVVERAHQIGHQKVFCKKTCEECDYYQLVHQQDQNVLLISDNEILVAELKRGAELYDYNFQATSCEYSTSAIVEFFRPDYAIIDCSLGDTRTRDICKHIAADPRIPFVKIVLAAQKGGFPKDCERGIFARIEKPFGAHDVVECINGGK